MQGGSTLAPEDPSALQVSRSLWRKPQLQKLRGPRPSQDLTHQCRRKLLTQQQQMMTTTGVTGVQGGLQRNGVNGTEHTDEKKG